MKNKKQNNAKNSKNNSAKNCDVKSKKSASNSKSKNIGFENEDHSFELDKDSSKSFGLE